MSAAPAPALTEDALLGGRVRLLQPRRGYRAATDPVLLAAAVPAQAGEAVLDLGCGVGAAALCLAARVPGLRLTGVEIDPLHVELARRNAELNGAALEVICGDVAALPAALRERTFEQVMMNPPYHAAEAADPSPDARRDRANREGEAGIALWIDAGLRRLAPQGRLTLIQRTERLPEVLGALRRRAGGIVIKPLAAREGRDAKRVLVTARKGAKSPLRLAAPLVLHEGPAHLRDGADFSAPARAILDGAALGMTEDR